MQELLRGILRPYVKIKKLNNFFPEIKSQFNIVYVLSNSPNLTLRTINILKKKRYL